MRRTYTFLSLDAHVTCLLPLLLLLQLVALGARTFTIGPGVFLKDGTPFKVISAEIHYFRSHPQDWATRLASLRAAGFNTVTTYVSWAEHEAVQGSFDFASPSHNLTAWLSAIAAADLLAIVRVGPYITAELDWGGLPAWLAAQEDIPLRTNDPAWLRLCDVYFDALVPQLLPFLYDRGGPIIDMQVEDDTDLPFPAEVTHAYYDHLAAALVARGVTCLLNTLCTPGTSPTGSCARANTTGAWVALEFSLNSTDPEAACADLRGMGFVNQPCMVMET